MQFYIFLIFFFTNIADIYYSLYSKDVDETTETVINDSRLLYVSIPLKIVCAGILAYFG